MQQSVCWEGKNGKLLRLGLICPCSFVRVYILSDIFIFISPVKALDWIPPRVMLLKLYLHLLHSDSKA